MIEVPKELLVSLERLFNMKADRGAKKRYLWQNVEDIRLWSLLAEVERCLADYNKFNFTES